MNFPLLSTGHSLAKLIGYRIKIFLFKQVSTAMNNHDASIRMHINVRQLSRLLMCAVAIVFCNAQTRAEFPVDRFLERLREARLQGLAVDYLEYLKSHGLLKPPYSDDFELTKLDLLQSDLDNIASADKRDARAKELEEGYKKFLQSNPNHPRRGEARTKLASLYIGQGQKSLFDVKKAANEPAKEALREKARASFQLAETQFSEGVNELGEELKKVLGAKIDPSDTAGITRRQTMQNDYRVSQLMIGQARKFMSDTYAEDSPERAQWLAKAEVQFTEVSNKASREKEAGSYLTSILLRGQVQAAQKKVAEAIDSLTRVTEQTEPGRFREMRVEATTSLVRLLASPPENKFEAAIQKGSSLLQEQQPSEKDSGYWQELQIAVLEAKDAWIRFMKEDSKNESNVRTQTKELRSELQKVSRLQSPAGAKAREMLASYGVDIEEPKELKVPKVRNFEEAFKEADELYKQWVQEKTNIQILQTQLENDPGSADKVKEQISKLESSQDVLNDHASQLYQRSLALFNAAKNERKDLTTARLRFATLAYYGKRYEDAAVVGELAARSNRGAAEGLQGATIAVNAYKQIVFAASEPSNKPMAVLNAFSQFVLENWPDSDVSGDASGAVLQTALAENRLDDAIAALDHVPASDKKAQIQRDVGYVMYGKYLEAVYNASKAGTDENAPEIVSIRDRAENLLQSGLPPLTPETLDARAIDAGWALAAIQLSKGENAQALETLNRATVGPVAALDNSALQLSSKIRMNILRLVLQAEVGQSSSSGEALNSARIESVVGEMQKVAGENPENEQLLTNALIVLANELRAQISQQQSADGKKKLASSLQVLLTRLIDVSQDPTMLQWASTTLSDLGESIAREPTLKSTADELGAATEKGFSKLIVTIRSKPEFLEKTKRKIEDYQYLKAKALFANGKHELAAKEYIDVLKANNSIPIQIDAAMNYQLWSNNKDESLLKKAAFGTDGVVWGWNGISKKIQSGVTKNKELAPFFLQATYQLADSRLNIGRLQTDAGLKTKNIEEALKVIKMTSAFLPTFGDDAATKAKFDTLTREIQKELKQEAVGLKAFGG